MKTIDLARVTIELQSPLAIGSGEASDLFDAPFVADASGLPCLPGTSLAGVMRSLWSSADGAAIGVDALFGDAPAAPGRGETRGARLHVSFGHIHDSKDRPVGARLSPDAIEEDPLLRFASTPHLRPHVRLGHRGSADASGRGLFDESLVAAGHRFTFEVEVQDVGREVLPHLLRLFAAETTRLGGKTRRGLGGFKVIRVRRRFFDLRHGDDYDGFAQFPRDLADASALQLMDELALESCAERNLVCARIWVRPRGPWIVAGGTSSAKACQGGREPDRAPYREPRVTWHGERAAQEVVVPGTSIKGAIRHRMGFHALALRGTFADELQPQRFQEEWEPNEVIEVFGHVPARSANGGQASAGRLLVEDLAIGDPALLRFDHVSLDRFSGGPMDGRLFSEEVCAPGKDSERWCLTIWIRGASEISIHARRALDRALSDLVEGRLPIGAGGARGFGFVEGAIEWSDPAWVAEEKAPS